MSAIHALADSNFDGLWRDDPVHRSWLAQDVGRQLDFFRSSTRSDGGFDVLEWDGSPQTDVPQELHITTRLVHSYVLGAAFGDKNCDPVIDAGMEFLWNNHRDSTHEGYCWSVSGTTPVVPSKLAYGHVFVLLAGASARQHGHPDADRLIADVDRVLDQHFWDEDRGLLREEYHRDWLPISDYRGMNANMHGSEAFLAAYKATGDEKYLKRAGRILEFFVGQKAPANGWRIPEHYTEDWQVDPDYSGNPMFRPAGTTPGHSLELGRLYMEYWELSGRPDNQTLAMARQLIEQALEDGWLPDGGLAYTLKHGGATDISDRYWWPVAEAIGAIATLQRLDPRPGDEIWYRRLWQFAYDKLVDHQNGGWFPELGEDGTPMQKQFLGKPDIYHSLQGALLALDGLVAQTGVD